MTCAQVTEQLDKYVLGTLASDVSTQVARHIETCVRCSKASAQARKTADVLSLVTESPQRPALRERVLAAMQPVLQADRGHGPLQGLTLPRTLEPSPASLPVILVLVLLSMLVVWGVRQVQDRLDVEEVHASQLRTQLEDRETLVSLMTDPSVSEYTVTGTDAASSATARFYADTQTPLGGLVVWNLPPSPAGTAYQVWLIDARGAFTSGGVFEVGSSGTASHLVRARQHLGLYQAMVVSVEPVHGSRQPIGPRVLAVSF